MSGALFGLLQGEDLKEGIKEEIREAAGILGITDVLQGRSSDAKHEIHTKARTHMEVKHDMGKEGVYIQNNL